MALSAKQRLELEVQMAGAEQILPEVSVEEPAQVAEVQTMAVDVQAWQPFKETVLACTKCSLCETRNQVVFGVGNPDAELMFVGEAPGADEDAQGKPFVGRAGQLLTKMIEAMGYSRETVYIANILKCRPPGNRNPEPAEIEQCLPFLKQQIRMIKPVVVCALGKFAAQTLLETETPISRLRGQIFSYEGAQFVPTYHPAYLLRNPSMKKPVWQDLKLVNSLLENARQGS